MAGILPGHEGIVIEGTDGLTADAGEVLHRYGRVGVARTDPGEEAPGRPAGDLGEDELAGLTEGERLGVAALRLRESEEFRLAKRQRPRDGEAWDMGGCVTAAAPAEEGFIGPVGAGGTSDYFEGTIGIGVVFVSGPGDLAITGAEQVKILAEAKEGLSWYRSLVSKDLGVDFIWDIRPVTLTLPKDTTLAKDDRESYWMTPVLKELQAGSVGEYAERLRAKHTTRWVYCAFFTKYALRHEGYAYQLGGPYLVIDALGGSWGVDNLDRVFAHETGHMFYAPDEYEGAPTCTCADTFGRFAVVNGNCATRAAGRGVPCIMQHNDFVMCGYTPSHLGWTVDGPLLNHDSGLAADVYGSSRGDGTPVITEQYIAGDNQHFTLRAVGNDEVCVIARHSGKVLTVAGGSLQDGAKVVQWVWGDRAHQRFKLEFAYFGGYALRAKHSDMLVDVEDPGRGQGLSLVQRTDSQLRRQRWRYSAQPIVALHSGKVLDVRGGSRDDGAEIVQFPPNGGAHQRFVVVPVDDAYVRVVAMHSGKVLDVSGASQDDGAKVVQWTWHGGDNQLFKIVYDEDGHGYIRLVAKHSGKVLDVLDSSVGDGASVVQWLWNLSANQRWTIL